MGTAAVNVRHQAGIAVLDRASVVGFGDGLDTEATGLTVVASDVKAQGKRAACQLISQIAGMLIRSVTILSAHLSIRDTSIAGQ